MPTSDPAKAVPTTIFISAHPENPPRYTIGAHLQTAPTAGRQFNTPYMPWPEVEQLLRDWMADRAEFLARHFDWAPHKAAESHGRLPPSNPHGGLSLADLGL